ncbi:MAG: PIN domain-containing protein [Rubrivivax sp.]|nr:PIN domain-containing protein [Rubrivivax sp.]
MRFAVDTNLLVYAEGEGDAGRCQQARACLAQLPPAEVLLPTQVLGELYNVLTRRCKRSAEPTRRAVLEWAALYAVGDSAWPALVAAMELNAAHQTSIWDALILSVASQHRCRVLLSEDLQHGFTWGGVTVVNPILHPAHPLLAP